MPENKFLLRIVVRAFLLVCVLCGPSIAAQMDLTEGGVRRGPVTVMERDGMLFVALEEVMARLSFASSPVNGGFVVTYSGRKIEFWNGANLARVNGAVNPLTAAVNFDGSHWWGEAASSLQAIKLFLSSASRPSDINIVPAASPSGNIPVNPALPVAPAPMPSPVQAPPPPPVQAPQPLAVQAPQPSSAINPYPIVSPGEAVISRVRWGEQMDAYRAVVDISGQVEAVMNESPGRAEVTFRGTGAMFTSSRSPWPSISVEAGRTEGGVTLAFSHSSERIRGFWVADPPRYVVDFYFSGAGPEPAMPVRVPAPDENISVEYVPVTAPSTGTIVTTPQQGAQPVPQQGVPAVPQQSVPAVPRQGAPPARNNFLVVIDAGHGGHDPGAVGHGLREKDINLLASLQLGISLKALGIDTRLTREDDRYLKLAERSDIANDANADVFISLHCNALPQGRRATGTELYLMAEPTDQDALNLALKENRELSGGAENAEEVNAAADKKTLLLLQILGDMQQSDKINESTNLAEFIYNELDRANIEIRKVRQAPFYVLRGAGMPALLIEMGYITEASDARKLNSQAEREKLMNLVAVGIKNYLTRRPGEGGHL